MTAVEILGLLVTAVVTVALLRNLRRGTLKRDYAALRTLKGWRWAWALVGTLAELAVVFAVGLGLLVTSPHVLGWSWLRLLDTTHPETPGRNLLVSGLSIPYFAWLFLVLLAVNVPVLAMNEELAFRKGNKTTAKIAWQSLKFGLAHCLVGIPIAFGLALSVAGVWFSVQYLKGGTRRSAAYHSLHNWTLLLLAGLWLSGAMR